MCNVFSSVIVAKLSEAPVSTFSTSPDEEPNVTL